MSRRITSREARALCWERDRGRCCLCGSTDRDWESDHAIPVKMGGSDELWNLRTLCVSCHRKVSADWARRLAGAPQGPDGRRRSEVTHPDPGARALTARLRAFRHERGGARPISQKRLAGLLGVHWTTIARWEAGTSEPSGPPLRFLHLLLAHEPALADLERLYGADADPSLLDEDEREVR